MRSGGPVSERAVVFIIGAVQFVNILEFMMVMPLGPDFAAGLGIPASEVGSIAAGYTWSAAAAGVLGSFFLDRFDRRKVLAIALLGLVTGTFAGGLAFNQPTLILARLWAGFFGGPATSVAFSIIADVVPSERRGKAMGAVMGAVSIASVIGVPAALKLAELGGWRTPFLVVGGLGALLILAAVWFLPPMTGHLAASAARSGGAKQGMGVRALFSQTDVLLSYTMTALTMMGGFLLIPNVSAYLQLNLGYPRQSLDILYMVGGVASFATMRTTGWLVDRYGSFRVGSVGAAAFIAMAYVGFVAYRPWVPVMAVFVAFMVALAVRNVSYNTLASKVPRPQDRARFMSFQSGVQHLASGLAMTTSAAILSVAGGRLTGIAPLAWISMALHALLPLMLFIVERRVRSRPVPAKAAAPIVAAPLPGAPPVPAAPVERR